MSSVIRDLTLAVSNLRTFLQAPYAPPPPPAPPAAPFAPPPPSTVAPKGLPITQIRFPSSLSPLPTWIDLPTYTTMPPQSTVLQPPATTFRGFGGYTDPSVGSSMVPQYSPPAMMGHHEGAYMASPHVQQPPRFTKLEFATYDGTVDPLNWLNQCDQFFRGQRTMAFDHTWIASYHLRGAAQMWYYALEQDEGEMPPWERFRDLCLLRFGPPYVGAAWPSSVASPSPTRCRTSPTASRRWLAMRLASRLASAPSSLSADSPTTSASTSRCATPQDLQMAMYYARAYEHRANAMQQVFPGRGTRPLTRPAPATATPMRPTLPATAAAASAQTRTFQRLTSAEQLERRRKGLCFNCDKPYAPGHTCAHLFYLETVDTSNLHHYFVS
jgi:hypothetical protein